MASPWRVLTRLKEANLTIELKKWHFAEEEVQFLGHVGNAQGITTDPSKGAAVEQWPQPKTANEVRAFLGLGGYYRNLIQGFSAIAVP